MALKLVPFNPKWIDHDKLDLKAIYRRPRFVTTDMDEVVQEFKDGLPQWDIVGPLPIKQHNVFMAKGFEYITLANRESLIMAARHHTLPAGTSAREFDQHQTGGPWHYKLYMQGKQETDTAEAQQLAADVHRFGSVAVEFMTRKTNPNFRLPEDLQGIEPENAHAAVDGRKSPRSRRGRIMADEVSSEVSS